MMSMMTMVLKVILIIGMIIVMEIEMITMLAEE